MGVMTDKGIHCTSPDCEQSLGKPKPVGGFRFRAYTEATFDERSALRYATLSGREAWVCCSCGETATTPGGWGDGVDNEPLRSPEHVEDPWACAHCGETNTAVPEIEDGDIDSTRGGAVYRECVHCKRDNQLNIYVLVDVHSIEVPDEDSDSV